MGLTLIRKSENREPVRDPKVALVLAGAAVTTGGAFKVGGLKALNDFLVDRRITDMDVYVGLSAGAVLSTHLAAGVSPDEMIRSLLGAKGRIRPLRGSDFYQLNQRELLSRPVQYLKDLATWPPGVLSDLLDVLPDLPEALEAPARAFRRNPSLGRLENLVSRLLEQLTPERGRPRVADYIPSGLFDNASVEEWMRASLARIQMPNEFRRFARKTGRELYITACDLDSAERVIFGADECTDLTISEAVQASSALPLLYKPARIHGRDFVDGGVRHTASIDIPIERGADLILCYNPFRPLVNRVREGEPAEGEESQHLAEGGLKAVANQVFRTLLHSRLGLGIQRYLADESFQGDIVLLEPQESDPHAFATNPLAIWRRSEQVKHGFESVRSTIEQNFEDLEEVFGRCGISLDRAAAQRRADRARLAQGWESDVSEAESESGGGAHGRLRLVGS